MTGNGVFRLISTTQRPDGRYVILFGVEGVKEFETTTIPEPIRDLIAAAAPGIECDYSIPNRLVLTTGQCTFREMRGAVMEFVAAFRDRFPLTSWVSGPYRLLMPPEAVLRAVDSLSEANPRP